jgi:hypothetical protein
MELVGDVGHVECHFGPFGNSVCVGARQVDSFTEHTTGSEIILNKHDASAR